MSEQQFQQTVMTELEQRMDGLSKLRKPFPAHLISKLPKPTKAQTDEVKADFRKGERCGICGTWHHPKVVHLDYVGHAALTDRLLDADPYWSWEPVAIEANGAPMLDKDGGMWIKLTVCGVTRLGYGDAQDKTGANATKERIGDALRNAAMRFGAALELWHKGELHKDDDEPVKPPAPKTMPTYPQADFEKNLPAWLNLISTGKKTADQIIAMVGSKATLTEQQQITIRAVHQVEAPTGEMSEAERAEAVAREMKESQQ